jgi:hypothetical protein
MIGGFPMAKKNNKYIIAVKDYENTVKTLSKENKSMPRDASVYIDLFNNVETSCSDIAGLKKFIRASKFAKKDCMHYWEGLMTLDYTLIITEYDSDDENFVENSCDNELLKFISAVR